MNSCTMFFLKFAIIFELFLFCVSGFCGSADEWPTHCAANEVTYFSCQIGGGNNVASICGEGLDEEGNIYADTRLSYRHGPIRGRLFNYPRHAAPISSGRFRGEYMKPYGEDYESKAIVFRDMNTEYSVEIIDSFNSFVGVIEVVGKKISQYPCVSGTVTQSLLTLILSLPSGRLDK